MLHLLVISCTHLHVCLLLFYVSVKLFDFSLTLCQISPQKKLPAFYVLDSVVKNVGTPYTLFFGRQLYSTFMEAYVLVDNSTRRKMEEMLKTWKEPVPGSIDTRPVFPPDVTRPIENALIKARTSAVQAQQEQLRSQQQFMGRGRPLSTTPFRDTPTPPGQLPIQPLAQGPPSHGANFGQQQYPPPGAPQTYPNQMNGQQGHGLPPVRFHFHSHSGLLIIGSDLQVNSTLHQ